MPLMSREDAPVLHPCQSLRFHDYDFSVGLLDYAEGAMEKYSVVCHEAPCESGAVLELSALDMIMPRNWMPFTYAFQNTKSQSDFMSLEKLKSSLSKTLAIIPALAGRLECEEGGSTTDFLKPKSRTRILLNNRGAWFSTAKMTTPFTEMLNEHFCTTLLPAPFIFKKFVSTVIESRRASVDIPLIAAKAVYFPCGSVVLTVYINHIVCDSRSMYEFVRLWGKISRGLTPEPLIDSRHLLASLHTSRSKDSKAAEKKFESQAPFQPLTTDMRMCTVRVHETRLKQLNKEINSKLGSNWVTCEELFFCIVCRMLLRARKCDLGPYYIRTVNIRKYLDLDNSAFGNFTGVPFEDPIKMADLLTVPLEKAIPEIKGRLLMFNKRSVAKTVQDYLSVDPAALSEKLKKIGPRAVDSNNLANHDPSQIDFDDSPACYFFSCLYINGAFTINPVYNGHHNSCVGVDELIINDLKNDKEALDLGFTITPLRKLLLK